MFGCCKLASCDWEAARRVRATSWMLGGDESADTLLPDAAMYENITKASYFLLKNAESDADDMEQVTTSVSDEFAAELAAFMADNHYQNRSEAIRDLARLGLKQVRLDGGIAGKCIATLSYVFNHHTRELTKRLTDAHHDHHELQVATMHVHLGHEQCLEVAVLHGDATVVREYKPTSTRSRPSGVWLGPLYPRSSSSPLPSRTFLS
jgi:CopG family transcriptional regulator, nickel-responsive regulator